MTLFPHPAPPIPWLIGHRGAAARALENTLPSFVRAVADGADMVEMDVQHTADGGLAVVHDWTLQRLAGSPLVVETSSWSTLRALALRLDGEGAASGSIPNLEDALAALPFGFPVNIELKRARAPRGRFAAAVVAALGSRPGVLVSSFDWPLLAALRALAPALPLAPLADREPGRLLRSAERLGAWAIHVHRRLVTPDLVAVAAAAERPVLAYTVNHPEEAARLLAHGVAGLFTDDPAALRRALSLTLPQACVISGAPGGVP